MDSDEDISAESEALRQFLPSGFGKQTLTVNVEAQLEQARRKAYAQAKESKPKPPPADSDDDDDDDDDDAEEEDEFPVSHEIVIKSHEKAITTMTLDASGSRLVTGSLDCTLKLHDFAAMTPTTVRAFKSVDPTESKSSASSETHPIHHVSFNPLVPSQMLVVSATSQARILDRDGVVLTEFVKGDMYLRDLHQTKGHTAEVSNAAWHPKNAELFVTSSVDGTVRIWDVNNRRSQKEVIVYRSKAAGSAGRTKMTAVCWGAIPGGNQTNLVASALDGSLVLYSGDGPFTRPAAEINDAHKPGTWTSGLDISSDGRLVVTRGGDDTIKLWDTRNFKQPLKVVSHVSTSSTFPTSNILFSPTSTNIITGSDTGDLHFLNPFTLKPDLVTPITPGSPLITVQWHSKLNQILTGSANAEVHVLFNPTLSKAGAKSVLERAPKRRHIDDDPNNVMDLSQGVSSDAIVAPGSMKSGSQSAMSFAARHPNVGLTASGRSRDPRRPHIPDTTPFAKSQPDEEHIKNSIPLSAMRDEDPREALLKYADKAKNDPMFTKAWKDTQPKTIYADFSDEEDEPEKKKARR